MTVEALLIVMAIPGTAVAIIALSDRFLKKR